MTSLHLSLAPFCLAALTTAAGAQGFQPPVNPKTFGWPSAPTGYGNGSFERSVVGRFTGDGKLSAMVLRNDAVFFAFDPALYQSVAKVATSAPVFDLLALPSATPRRDVVLLTTPDRPVVASLQPDATFVTHQVLGLAWARASGLRARVETSTGLAWITGIGANGTSVLTACRTGPNDPMQVAIIDAGMPVREVHSIDWDGDGALEAAAFGDAGLAVFEMDGTPIGGRAWQLTGAVGAVLADERLACVGTLAGVSCLQVVSQTQIDPPVAIDTAAAQAAGPLDVTGLAAADQDGDGDTDLLLSHASSHVALLLHNLDADGSPASFSSTAQTGIELAPAGLGDPALDRCPMLFDNLDSDAIPDVLAWLDSTGGMSLYFDPGLLASVATGEIISEARYDGSTLTVQIPQEFGTGYSHVRIVAWHQSNPTGDPPPLDADAALNQSFALSQVALNGSYVLGLSLQPDMVPSLYWPNADHYYLEIGFENETTGAVSPSQVVGLTMKTGPGSTGYAYYLENTLVGADWGMVEITQRGSFRPDKIGIIITRKEPPPFAPGVIPGTGG